ncbi:MAG: zinc ribbon domain-containing protein [Acidimicrobiales bacterium]
MAPCQCGTSNADDARFCASCGAALGEPVGLLGTTSTVTNVATTEGIDRRWMVAVGALLIAVIGWSVSSGRSNEATPGEDQRGAELGDDTTTTTVPPTTSTGGPTTTKRTTTTTEPEPPTVTIVGDGGPLVGEPTGLRLIIGANSYRPSILDLDTGELVTASRSGGGLDPQLVSGEWLVARQSERLVAVPLDDLGADPVTLLPENSSPWLDLADLTPRTDGRAWVYTYDENATLMLVDLATGEPIDEAFADGHVRPGVVRFALGTSDGPLLVDHAGGGVYEYTEGRYRQVSEGHLIVADDRRALVESCDDELVCRREWFDRRTWQPAPLEVPSSRADEISFLNGSDWMILYQWGREPSAEMFNVVTGRQRPLVTDPYSGFVGERPVVSTDGRWGAATISGDLVIVDLASDAEWHFDDIGLYSNQSVFTTLDVGYALRPIVIAEDGASG